MLGFSAPPTIQPAAYLAAGRADTGYAEPGAVAEYLAMFPEREFRWDPNRQLWAVWDTDPSTGYRSRVEFVCNRLERDDRTPAGLWENDMFTGGRRLVWIGESVRVRMGPGGHRITFRHDSRVYRPIDYPFVRYRVREHARMLELGREAFFAEIDEANEKRSRSETRDVAREVAAANQDARRWRRAARGGEKPTIGRGFGGGLLARARALLTPNH